MIRHRRSTKKLFTGIPVILFLVSAKMVFACWGTRPLGMGGAFTGLADDTNAIYWNPAGLGRYPRPGITHASSLGDENSSNYDHYGAANVQLTKDQSFGLAVATNKTHQDSGFIERDTYLQVAYGIRPLTEKNIAIGIGLKAVDTNTDGTVDDKNDEWFDLDLGMLWQIGPETGKQSLLSLGFLFQNLGRAKFIKPDEGPAPDIVRNFRPGLSINPDDETRLTFELYDALGATDGDYNDLSQNVRLGAERWFCEYVALRAGVYHLNNKFMRAYTGGLGIKLPEFWKMHTQLDFTLMHWDYTRRNTSFGGLTIMF